MGDAGATGLLRRSRRGRGWGWRAKQRYRVSLTDAGCTFVEHQLHAAAAAAAAAAAGGGGGNQFSSLSPSMVRTFTFFHVYKDRTMDPICWQISILYSISNICQEQISVLGPTPVTAKSSN
ncbi:hypothetical protein PVAP13_3KG078227 [Panicum virgatum]|uniref:Uncharacterized protein n=1 Tax=Panicum virgatum TaxID=38727 RepID=A0A8T0USF0_PANVG|nr:hypothetical protein PVAP13_3KG078227 [Panicum virgatum]